MALQHQKMTAGNLNWSSDRKYNDCSQWLILYDLALNSKVNFHLTIWKENVVGWWVGQMARERTFFWREIGTGLGAVIKLEFKCWSRIMDTRVSVPIWTANLSAAPAIRNGSRRWMQHGSLPTSDWLEALSQRPPDSCQTDWHLIITDLVWSPVTDPEAKGFL